MMSLTSNRLGREKSPYLLQHAHNPVDWFPWGEEAFQKAIAEDKPVFLSIGYSTCHWCHVMEDESFSEEATAAILNRDFVAVKVDREERPDIDSVYMNFVMASTGSGGWPMSVFLTPEKKPFYGGTYFPPTDRYGMPGFKTLLTSIAEAWKNRKNEVMESAESSVTFLRSGGARGVDAKLTEETLYRAFERFKSAFDSERGGFGGAPKFPRSHSLSMLLRYWERTANHEALKMTEKTLGEMANGALRDHLGGGFHRYSTDAQWRVPHFEKMLYDQALLAHTYLEAREKTGRPEFGEVARQTLDYVLREMTSPEGGFYSAQDADSLDANGKKKEGAFYVWSSEEFFRVLGPADGKIAAAFFGVTEEGNAITDPHQEFTNLNVLYAAQAPSELASRFAVSEAEVSRVSEVARRKLLGVRSKRPAPHLDDKILADWNGLMIAAFALGARVLKDKKYADAASRAADFIQARLKKDSRLLHRYRDGEASLEANLNDYASLIYGLLELHAFSGEAKRLDEAGELARRMIDRFWDAKDGGFFLTADDAEVLITRPKELYDGAIPSGNSMAVLTLLLLSERTGDPAFASTATRALEAFSQKLSDDPTSYPQMMIALGELLGSANVCRDGVCTPSPKKRNDHAR